MEVITLLVLIALGAAGARNIPSTADQIEFIDDEHTDVALINILFSKDFFKQIKKEKTVVQGSDKSTYEDSEDQTDAVVTTGSHEDVANESREVALDENRIVFRDDEEDKALVPVPTAVASDTPTKVEIGTRNSMKGDYCLPGYVRMGSLCAIKV
ncbi:hypothetical protein B5X24_HaOG203208 [Helicoverpa armigera]|uniref:Uncharacterized protein n=1 Tax=Helicoverpa armigera TaxID=29058 RepID=A0A2W1BVB3_HELAM|nr:hypothetical protein B5X24_HaOG203208 [Helicoverpa armigera]